VESKRPKCALCSRELLFDEVERGICGCCICTEKTSDQRTIESLTTQLAALTEGNAKLKAEVAILESEVVRRDARIADMKSTPMPNDLVSREAVMAAVGKMKAIGGLAKFAVKSVIEEVPAALPAAGDERPQAAGVCREVGCREC
jgi:hypothetical protein